MARQRKPEGESTEQATVRRMLETVANNANRSAKTSWNRKMDNMVKLIAELRPFEEQILALIDKKMPIIDRIQELRLTMVKECVHPFEKLVYHDKHVLCKFCNKKMGIPNDFSQKV